MGDPGRTYMPKSGVKLLARYQVATSRELEDLMCAPRRFYRLVPTDAVGVLLIRATGPGVDRV